jgi:acyl-CoA synthetase (AMP-forming)/AMP-acid ligase II
MPETLGAAMVRNAALFGNKIAIFDDENAYTHDELLSRSRAIAEGLSRRGVRRQDRVALLFGNGLDIITMFGAMELYGFVAVPLNWRLSAAEALETIEDCQPSALIFEPRFAETAKAIAQSCSAPVTIVSTGVDDGFAEPLDQLLSSPTPQGDPARAKPNDLAYIIYTSGSSGKPKGVMLDQRNQMNSVRIMATEMRLAGDDRGFISMPLFHVGARLYQSAVALCGGPAFIAGRYDPGEALRAIEAHKLTFAPMVPTMVERLIDHPELASRDLSSLRMILYTGAPMPGPVIRKAIKLLGPRFLQQYGQTENCGGASLYPHHHAIEGARGEEILGSVGHPGMHASIAIVDDDFVPVSRGEVGEVLLKSGAAMRGYWNNSSATAETIRDGWICTGDLGRFDDEGFLFIVGRKKDMIISGGENIFAGEVEEALAKHPAVAQVAVIGVPDDKWGEAVKAFIVCRTDVSVEARELIEHCTALIATYKRPKLVELVEQLPLNSVGKIDKKLLRALNGAPLAA